MHLSVRGRGAELLEPGRQRRRSSAIGDRLLAGAAVMLEPGRQPSIRTGSGPVDASTVLHGLHLADGGKPGGRVPPGPRRRRPALAADRLLAAGAGPRIPPGASRALPSALIRGRATRRRAGRRASISSIGGARRRASSGAQPAPLSPDGVRPDPHATILGEQVQLGVQCRLPHGDPLYPFDVAELLRALPVRITSQASSWTMHSSIEVANAQGSGRCHAARAPRSLRRLVARRRCRSRGVARAQRRGRDGLPQ